MMPLDPRALAAFAHDVVAAALAWTAAYWLRFNLDIPQPFQEAMWASVIWVVPLQSAFFLAFGLYRGMWRYAKIGRAHV